MTKFQSLIENLAAGKEAVRQHDIQSRAFLNETLALIRQDIEGAGGTLELFQSRTPRPESSAQFQRVTVTFPRKAMQLQEVVTIGARSRGELGADMVFGEWKEVSTVGDPAGGAEAFFDYLDRKFAKEARERIEGLD